MAGKSHGRGARREPLKPQDELAAWFRARLAASPLQWQSDLAQRAHVSETLVSDLFRATRLVPEDKVLVIAAALDASPVDLETVRRLWHESKIAWKRAELLAKARPTMGQEASERFPVPGPRLLDLLQSQYRARESLPYRLLTERIPPLSKLYIRQDVQQSGATGLGGGTAKLTPGAYSVRSSSISEALVTHRHLLISAEPGGGKSTLLYYLAAQSAAWWLDVGRRTSTNDIPPPSGMTVPVRVSAKSLAGNSLPSAMAASVIEDLAEYMDGPEPSSDLFALPPMPDVEWLVMVDGVDEILEGSSRTRVINALASRLESKGDAGFRFLIVSRPLPSADVASLDKESVGRYTLEKFDDNHLKTFVCDWFHARASANAEIGATQFLALIDRSHLQSVVALPLLATIALIVYEQSADSKSALPVGRAALYSEFVHYLLHVRQGTLHTRSALRKQLGPYAYGENLADWIYDHLSSLLESVADEYLSAGGGLALSDLAVQWIQDRSPYPLDSVPDWKRILAHLLCSTGLLIERVGGLDFLHRSFAEYLAAGPLAQSMPNIISADTVRNVSASPFFPYVRSRALFALGRWVNARKGRDATDLVRQLIDGDQGDVLLAAEIITFEVRATSDLEDEVADSLSRLAKSSILEDWAPFVAALAALPTRDIAVRNLRLLAQGAGSLPLMRIRAASLMADLGDRDSSVDILVGIATVRPRRYRDEYDDDENYSSVPASIQDLRRRWELGEVDDDDLDNSLVVTNMRPMGRYEGSQSAMDELGSGKVESIAGKSLGGIGFTDLEMDDDLVFSAEAAWELADLGEIELAAQLLVNVAFEEYKVSYQSDYYISTPADYSYWAITAETASYTEVLTRISTDDSVDAAVRLSASFMLGDKPQIRKLANDNKVDVEIRLMAAQALAYFGQKISAEDVFISISSDLFFEINARLKAVRALDQFGGKAAMVSALHGMLTNPEEDPEDQIRVTLSVPGGERDTTALQALIRLARDRDLPADVRLNACHALSSLGRADISTRLIYVIARDFTEEADIRIDASRKLAVLGYIENASIILMEISDDRSIDSSAQIRALEALNILELG